MSLKWNKPFGNVKVESLFRKASNSAKGLKNEKARETQRNIVGIIGQPGVGKSTLTKNILEKLVNNELPEYDADYLFLVKLRDCQYNKETNLHSFLTHDCL